MLPLLNTNRDRGLNNITEICTNTGNIQSRKVFGFPSKSIPGNPENSTKILVRDNLARRVGGQEEALNCATHRVRARNNFEEL